MKSYDQYKLLASKFALGNVLLLCLKNKTKQKKPKQNKK